MTTLSSIVLAGFIAFTSTAPPPTHYVSALELVGSSGRYAGKQVALVGVLSIEKEGPVIYPTPWHQQIGDVPSGIHLRGIPSGALGGDGLQTGDIVRVVGTFQETRDRLLPATNLGFINVKTIKRA